jgi:tetratricopeptide (TPR) repeat protein
VSGDALDRLLELPARADLLARWAADPRAPAAAAADPFAALYDCLLAELWVDAGRMLRAVHHARRALRRRATERQRALLLRMEANALMGLGRAGDAVRAFGESWDAFRAAGERAEAARTTIAWVSAAGLHGDAKAAQRIAERGRRLLPRGAYADRARLEANLGGAWLIAGRYDRADTRIRHAMRWFERAHAKEEAGVCELNLGMNALVVADFREAGRRFERAQSTLAATGKEQMALYAAAGAAAVRLSVEASDGAWERLRDLGERFEARGDDRAAACRELGTVLSSLGAWEAAAPEAESAWKRFRNLGLAEDAARAAALYGRVVAALGGGQLAVSLLEQANAHWRRTGQRWAECRVVVEQARLVMRAGHAERALSMLRSAMPTLARRSPHGDAALGRALMAEAHLMLGHAGVARRIALRARKDARVHPVRLERPGIALVVAEANAAAGRPRAAREWARRAVRELEESLLRFGRRRFRILVGGSRTRIYRRAVNVVLRHGGRSAERQALDLLSRARSPVLVEDILADPDRIRPSLRSALVRLRDELLDDQGRPESRGARVRTLGRRLDRVAERLAPSPRRLPAVLRRAWDERGLARWEGLLGNRRLVFFDRSEGDWRAFVVGDGRTVRCVELPKLAPVLHETWIPFRLTMDAIARTPLSERAGFLDETRPECVESLRRLREAVWPAFGADADRAVVLIPDAELHAVPLEAAVECEGPAPVVSRLPHPALLRRPPPPPSRRALLVRGDSPGTAREVAALGRVLRRSGWGVRRGARRADLARGDEPLSLLHVAAHGAFHPEGWLRSGLRLADGWLGLEQLPADRLRGALICFTSCESGLAGTYPGSDLEGWITAGLAAGARELALTLWKVDDTAAQAFTAGFYPDWIAGAGAAAAAAAARRRIRRVHPHPFHWAGFLSVA